MNNFSIEKYNPKFESAWNEFILNSKNGTFLFHRNYMDYHHARFEDASLMVFKKKKLMALFPANKVGHTIHSHQGLSFGGLILNPSIKLKDVISIFENVLCYLSKQHIALLKLKAIPKIYHKIPSDEIEYVMHILKAQNHQIETLSVIDLNATLKVSKSRMEGVKRGEKHLLDIRESQNFDMFWNSILIPNLKKRYNANPVHSLDEIELLKSHFPNQMRQFDVYHKGEIVAGTTIFESNNVAHCQYISASDDKNSLGSLDFLHHHLITKVFKHKAFYDFGSSNENNGQQINEGLLFWKEGFGARTVIKNHYTIETKNFNLLNNILI